MDNVVVVGGAGFIGRSLTRLLLDAGCAVTVVSRSAATRLSNHPRLRYEAGAVGDAARMDAVIEGADIVYDLALGRGATWEDYKREMVGGAMNVARASVKHRVRRHIYASTISAIYLGGRRPVDEKSGNEGPSPKRGPYCRAKSLVEDALLEMKAKDGLPVVIFRPGVVLGPGGKLVHPALGDIASNTCVLGFGNGRYPLPCVLVEDVAQAMFLAKDAPGVDGLTFNLAGDVRPTAAEYVQILRERTRRNFRFYGRAVWWIKTGEIVRWTLKELARRPENPFPPLRDFNSIRMSAPLDCSLAKRMLGWKPVSDRDEFIRRAIDCHIQPIPEGDLRLENAL